MDHSNTFYQGFSDDYRVIYKENLFSLVPEDFDLDESSHLIQVKVPSDGWEKHDIYISLMSDIRILKITNYLNLNGKHRKELAWRINLPHFDIVKLELWYCIKFSESKNDYLVEITGIEK